MMQTIASLVSEMRGYYNKFKMLTAFLFDFLLKSFSFIKNFRSFLRPIYTIFHGGHQYVEPLEI